MSPPPTTTGTPSPGTSPTEPPPAEEEGKESLRTIHVSFVFMAFAAGCLLLPPRQWISAILMGVVTLALAYKWRSDVRAWWREFEEGRAKAKAAKTPKVQPVAVAASEPAYEKISEPEQTSAPAP